MKKFAIKLSELFILLVIFVKFPFYSVLAHNFHGDFSNTSNLCESCHRILSQFPGEKANFCLFCHDGTTPGANVLEDFDPLKKKSIHLNKDKKLDCGLCHSPHVNRSSNPKLLKSRGMTQSGEGICLDCHIQESTSTMGRLPQNNFLNSAHFIRTPSSTNSKISCLQCHNPHGSTNPFLISFKGEDESHKEENLCFSCHKKEEKEFSYASHHPVSSKKTGLECVSCHNPHSVQSEEGKEVSDPQNTQKFSLTTSEFCLKCHSGNAPQVTITTSVFIPYSINFRSNYGPFFNGWNKEDFLSSSHFKAGFSCFTCHHPHGSRNLNLTSFKGDNSFSYSEEKLCLTCHCQGGGAKDVEREFKKRFSHPIERSFLHRDGEDFADLAYFPVNSMRHAECVDCHDPHLASNTSGGSVIQGVLKGVGGVNSSLQVVNPITKDYELCFKCHSNYTILPPGQSDLSKAFSLLNPSYHPLEGRGKNKGIKEEAFISPWDENSLVSCLNCHGSEDGSKGVHGSNYSYILKMPYQEKFPNHQREICFLCHRYEVYKEPSPYTRFSSHYIHTSKFSCRACHESHGSKHPYLITDKFSIDGKTYFIDFSLTKRGGSCGISPDSGCHKKKEYEKQY